MAGIDRKFITWDYRTPDGRRYENIEIRYRQPREGAEFPFSFYCYFKSPGVQFKVESSSVDELRQQIIDRLDSLNSMTWTPWLFIAVYESGTREPPEDMRWNVQLVVDGGLSFSVHYIERAQDKDGNWYWRHTKEEGRFKHRPKAWTIHKGSPWDESKKTLGWEANDYGYALVEDTHELRAKLEAVASALRQLREKLAEIVNAKDVVQKFLDMRVLPRLIAVAEEGKKHGP